MRREERLRGLAVVAGCLVLVLAGCKPGGADDSAARERALTGTVTLDSTVTFQNLDGFGFNAAPRNWGTDGHALTPALDLEIADMMATKWRVEIFKGEVNWESINDDANPATFNWSYYDNLYSTNKDFTDLWAFLRYLNAHGVNDIMLAVHGVAPAWMGGTWNGVAGGCVDRTLAGCTGAPANAVDELVETEVSFLEYVLCRIPAPRPQFKYFGPFNESNIGPPEGIQQQPGTVSGGVGQTGAVGLLRKLVDRMNAEAASCPALSNIQLVTPDNSSGDTSWRDTLSQDAVVWARVAADSAHSYADYITLEPGPTRPTWLTEFNGFGAGCNPTRTFDMDRLQADILLNNLDAGVSAALVWDAFDNFHAHSQEWETFGMIRTNFPTSVSPNGPCVDFHSTPPTAAQLDQATYAPHSGYYVTKQFYRFIHPGARRVSVTSTDGSLHVVGFTNPDGSATLVGRNSATSTHAIAVALHGLSPTPTALTLYSTTASTRFVNGGTVALDGSGAGTVSIPADSVFTLTTAGSGPAVTLTTPADGAVFDRPTSIAFGATATASSGRTVSRVDYLDQRSGTILCTASAAGSGGNWPCTWNSPALGTYPVAARATDSTGATGLSALITLYVRGAAPSVALTAPTAGTYTTPVDLTFRSTATATTGLAIARVEYAASGTARCVATGAGAGGDWPCTWSGVPAGSYSLTARAFDTAGASGVSAPVAITVNPGVVSTLLGDTAIEPAGDSNSAGSAEAFLYTASASGAAARLLVYLDASNAATTVSLGLYASNGSGPGNLLGSCTIGSPAASSWNSCSLSTSVTVAAGTSYWIALLGTGGTVAFRDQEGGNASQSSAQSNLGSLPATWSPGTPWATASMSAYAATAPATGGTPPAVATPSVAPAGPAIQGAVLTFSAAVTAGSSPVARVDYASGSTLLCTATASPWSCTFTAATGAYSVSATVFDNASPPQTASSPGTLALTVTAATAPAVSTPTVTPSGPYAAGNVLSFAATVSPGSWPISRVEYASGGTVLCTARQAPWGCSWTAVAGSYAVLARAYDDRQAPNVGTSPTTLSLSVAGSAPPPIQLGDSTVEPSDDSTSAGQIDAYRATASATGQLTQLSVYLPASNAAGSVRVGVYSDSGGRPAGLLGAVTITTAVRGSWNSAALASPLGVTQGTSYWLAVLSPAGGGPETLRVTPSTGSNCWSAATANATLPASFGPSACGAGRASIYGN
jgi:hypothetical protein